MGDQRSNREDVTDQNETDRVLKMMEEGKLSESDGRKVLNALKNGRQNPSRCGEDRQKENDSSGWFNSSIMYLIGGGVAGVFIGFFLIPVSFFLAIFLAIMFGAHTEHERTSAEQEANDTNPSAHQELIDRPGTYELNPATYKLTITPNQGRGNHRVTYTLKNTERNDPSLASGEAGTNDSSWFFYWSDKKRLWVFSGATGLSMLEPGNEDTYKHRPVNLQNPKLVAEIPEPVYQNLSLALHKKKTPQQEETSDDGTHQDSKQFRITYPVQKSFSLSGAAEEPVVR